MVLRYREVPVYWLLEWMTSPLDPHLCVLYWMASTWFYYLRSVLAARLDGISTGATSTCTLVDGIFMVLLPEKSPLLLVLINTLISNFACCFVIIMILSHPLIQGRVWVWLLNGFLVVFTFIACSLTEHYLFPYNSDNEALLYHAWHAPPPVGRCKSA